MSAGHRAIKETCLQYELRIDECQAQIELELADRARAEGNIEKLREEGKEKAMALLMLRKML